MVKVGDKCRYRFDGEKGCLNNASSTVLVLEVNGDEAIVLSEVGEWKNTFKVKVSNLESGEYVWQPTAEWRWNTGRACDEAFYFCSRCAEGESDTGNDNYCNKCGAKMRRE